VPEVKSGPALHQAAGSQLVAVMRRNGALAADYAQRHGVPRWYDDARALVNDPEVDAVYVATPPGAHLDGALLAAKAGKPAYVEKPMARHTPECDAMVAAFAQAKRKLFVAYYRRALPRFVKMKELLDTGALGRMTALTCRFASPGHAGIGGTAGRGAPPMTWRIQPENSGGGLLLDVGSHALDLLDFFGGALSEVSGHAARVVTPGEVEDTATISFRTATGVPGSATFNFASHVKDDALDITGETGRVSGSVFGNEPIRFESAAGVRHFDLPNRPHIQQPLIQLVVDDLLGRGACPSTGESARRTNAVIDRVLASYYGGREDEFWLRPKTWPG